jgi:hypothetical protein
VLAAMPFDVTILSTSEYLPEELVMEEIPDKYLYNDQGELLFTSTIFNSEETISQLINFIFPGSQSVREIYRNKNSYILDLSSQREQLIDFEYLSKFYPKWIEDTKRENSMNEYGMLIDFIGHAKKGKGKTDLLMIVSSKRHCS